MKKIFIMLTVLGCVHFGAKAQVGAGTNHNNNTNMNQGDQGQKIDVIEGRKNAGNTDQAPVPTAAAITHTTTVHTATVHKMVYHKPVHHATMHRTAMHHTAVHHSYAKAGTHKHITHKTTHAVAMHRTMTRGYSGNRPNTYSGTTNAVHTTTVTPLVDNAKNQNAAVNKKIPDTPYPGASNGGWSNGTNGKGGTNVEDGTVRTDRRDN